MYKVDFNYNDDSYIIQCNKFDKMKDAINKFLTKSNKNKNNLYFLYNGQIINEELNINKCANSLDRSKQYLNVLVLEGQSSENDINNFIKSDYIICPICNENALISIKDFKITIYGCKNEHKTENIQINEFGKTQFIDISKIKCSKCQTLKSETYKNLFYFYFSNM